ncbi:unnamed protein product [Rotaria sp. Silwood2]|nr:unnamed protein product [Rotaria sp. Silwood2]CAF2968561.1 unnamed protein product [Rotaria sp. Silwood2]CAF3391407.1 unnamed protein product [Rotaria sp. Silwood2]CAF4536060.1 unnamed protein product [Rotaria sp. Silwood2]
MSQPIYVTTALFNRACSIQKFDGHGDAEHGLQNIVEIFDLLQTTTPERNELVLDILTGAALIWYVKQQDHMSTFITLMRNFSQYYSQQELKTESSTAFILSNIPLKQTQSSDGKETVIYCLRNQMLINNLEKLPKYSGKSKQNVSKWLRETE